MSYILNDQIPLDTIQFEDDPYFAGAQGGLQTADIRTWRMVRVETKSGVEYRRQALDLQLERTPDGMVVYRRAAIERAARASIKRGGGVRGLCSRFLRDNEVCRVPDNAATVGDVRLVASML